MFDRCVAYLRTGEPSITSEACTRAMLPCETAAMTLPAGHCFIALGMSRASTDRTQMMIDAIEAIQSGRELSDLVKSELAAHADAELSGAELLADIVQAHRKA